MREEGCFNIHGKQLPTSKILLIFIHWKPISTTIQWNTGLNTNERLTLECVTVCLMNLCVSIGVFPMSTQNCITGLCSTLFENVFFSDEEGFIFKVWKLDSAAIWEYFRFKFYRCDVESTINVTIQVSFKFAR
jgi:hypothetical protein